MPEKLSTGFFIFSAVLILLALVGGKFKIFGAEISRTVGKSVRVLAFVLGVVLFCLGLWLEQPVKKHDIISGIYRGYCRNSTGQSGDLRLTIIKDPAGKITGNINIAGNLHGSGNIDGQVFTHIISFHNTIESGLPNQLEKEKIKMSWTGNIKLNGIEGEYVAAMSPKLRFKGINDQRGTWKVKKIDVVIQR